MYVRCMFVQYAAVCHYRRFVCVSGAPVRVRSGHSTAHEPPEDGRKYEPKHVGATSLKCF
jgi:hypothetical protein